MLKARFVTAVVLLLVLIPALIWLPQAGWALFAALIVALGGWEWGRLMAWRPVISWAYAFMLFLLLAVLIWFMPQVLVWPASGMQSGMLFVYGAATLFWLLIVPLVFYRKFVAWSGLGAFLGFVVLLPPWFALVQFRALGVEILLAVLSVAWVADIAAYFSGKRFGKHKLAPSISPGKTWEGAAGAVAGVALVGFLVGPWPGFSVWLWGSVLLVLTGVSILGDLFESLLKRAVGLKDSSQLLPGHGGILDRIDSLTAILPVAGLIGVLMEIKLGVSWSGL